MINFFISLVLGCSMYPTKKVDSYFGEIVNIDSLFYGEPWVCEPSQTGVTELPNIFNGGSVPVEMGINCVCDNNKIYGIISSKNTQDFTALVYIFDSKRKAVFQSFHDNNFAIKYYSYETDKEYIKMLKSCSKDKCVQSFH